MNRDLELFQFIAGRLRQAQPVMLLVVAESSGSSPGRQGYKMAVAADGSLVGSIGGGLMEVNLVNQSREILSEPGAVATGAFSPQRHGDTGRNAAAAGNSPLSERAASETPGRQGGQSQYVDETTAFTFLKPQVHKKNAPNSSGMICSGRQTVIFKLLTPEELNEVETAVNSLSANGRDCLTIGPATFTVGPPKAGTQNAFQKRSDTDFLYTEILGPADLIYIIGGGHCALALSELMSRLDFHIRLFDDRPNLNTLEKNRFADEMTVIDSYERIADHVPDDRNAYVVVMTLGYKTDEIVIQKLLDRDFKYFGVLGSKAKMATLLKQLKQEGFSEEKLNQLHTPIGFPINSRTPEEIAVSIAAEIISIRNTA